MSQNFDIVPHSMSHINHNGCIPEEESLLFVLLRTTNEPYTFLGIGPPLDPIPHTSPPIFAKSAEIYDLPLWRKFLAAPRKEPARTASTSASVLCSLVRWSRDCKASTLYDDEDEEAAVAEAIFQSEDDITRILAGLDDHDEIVPVEKSRQEEAPLIEENGIKRTDHHSEVVEAKEVIDVEEDADAEKDGDVEEHSATSMKTANPLLFPVPLPRKRHTENESSSKDLLSDISGRSSSSHYAQSPDPNLVISMYPAGMGGNGVTVTNFLMILELYLELNYFLELTLYSDESFIALDFNCNR